MAQTRGCSPAGALAMVRHPPDSVGQHCAASSPPGMHAGSRQPDRAAAGTDALRPTRTYARCLALEGAGVAPCCAHPQNPAVWTDPAPRGSMIVAALPPAGVRGCQPCRLLRCWCCAAWTAVTVATPPGRHHPATSRVHRAPCEWKPSFRFTAPRAAARRAPSQHLQRTTTHRGTRCRHCPCEGGRLCGLRDDSPAERVACTRCLPAQYVWQRMMCESTAPLAALLAERGCGCWQGMVCGRCACWRGHAAKAGHQDDGVGGRGAGREAEGVCLRPSEGRAH
jgi:hypothetical protein